MILRSYRSLGSFPEVVVFSFLLFLVGIKTWALVSIELPHPVVLIPHAEGTGPIDPATADADYAEAIAVNFVTNWSNFSEYNYAWRRSQAVALLAASARASYRAQVQENAWTIRSLAQSQSYLIDAVEAATDGQLWQVRISGRKRVFYGGIGGEDIHVRTTLLLAPVTPTPDHPLALVIIRITEQESLES